MLRINAETEIPEDELTFSASRSGGPGGQNVNKLNTRVTLSFDIPGSRALTEVQKHRLQKKLARRISKEGVLRIVSQEQRTQSANRRAAAEKFVALVSAALKKRKARRKTSIPRAQKLRRLEEKRLRSELKRRRASAPRPE